MYCHAGESKYRMENLSTEMYCYVTLEKVIVMSYRKA